MSKSLLTLIVSVQVIISIIMIPERANAGGPAGTKEIFIRNGASDFLTFKMEKVSGKNYWDENFDLNTTSIIAGGQITIDGTPGTGGWNFHGKGIDQTQNVGYGLYKISRDASHYFFFDLKTDEIETVPNIFDIYFKWDPNFGQSGGFRCDSNLDCEPNVIPVGFTKAIWAETVATEQKDAFEPTNPTNLTMDTGGQHPDLSWTASKPTWSSGIGGAKYKVYRRQNLGSWNAITGFITTASYEDDEVTFGGNDTYYYKIRARNGDNTKWSALYTNTVHVDNAALGKRISRSNDISPRSVDVNILNYPNPFNPVTTLTFRLPEASNVSISVYDVAGREVALLANGNYSAGEHFVTWDGSQSASGMYFYRMTTNQGLVRGKMMLLK